MKTSLFYIILASIPLQAQALGDTSRLPIAPESMTESVETLNQVSHERKETEKDKEEMRQEEEAYPGPQEMQEKIYLEDLKLEKEREEHEWRRYQELQNQ